MKVNLTEIEIKDLNGVVYSSPELVKDVANFLFTDCRSIEVSDIARKLHKGEEAELNDQELTEIIQMVEITPIFKPFAKRQIIDYLKSKFDGPDNQLPDTN